MVLRNLKSARFSEMTRLKMPWILLSRIWRQVHLYHGLPAANVRKMLELLEPCTCLSMKNTSTSLDELWFKMRMPIQLC